MIVEIYMQIPVEKLSNYKTNLIYAYLNPLSDPIGQVVKVKDEAGENIYRCDVFIYKNHEKEVTEAMSTEAKRLADGNTKEK